MRAEFQSQSETSKKKKERERGGFEAGREKESDTREGGRGRNMVIKAGIQGQKNNQRKTWKKSIQKEGQKERE